MRFIFSILISARWKLYARLPSKVTADLYTTRHIFGWIIHVWSSKITSKLIHLRAVWTCICTSQPLSDPRLHKCRVVCRGHAWFCLLGNHFLYHQSWRRSLSLCWPSMWTIPPWTGNLTSDCRGLHIYRIGKIQDCSGHRTQIRVHRNHGNAASLHVNKQRIFFGFVEFGRQNHLVPKVWGGKKKKIRI